MAISNAAVWKDIYAFQDESGQRNTAIEETLSEIEGAYCAARASLVRQSPLGIDQRLAVARFMAFQLIRTPRSLQLQRDEFAHHMTGEVLSVAADPHRFHLVMRKQYDSDQACEAARVSLLSGGWHFEADHFTGLHAMMNTISDIWLWICLMRWTVYVSDGNFKLLTSDNPVTAWTDRSLAGRIATEVGVGLADPELRLSLPITPLMSLVAEHTPFSLVAVNADEIDDAHAKLRTWSSELRYRGATPNRIKVLNHATVVNASQYVFHCERNTPIERFLRRYLLNQPAPVRRRDRKPIGSPE